MTVAAVSRAREAAAWRALGLLFERPRAGWCRELEMLAEESRDPELVAPVQAASGAGEGEYLKTLGPGGGASPRAVAYLPMGDPGQILAELRRLYQGFAYRPGDADPPDHLAVEVGFVAYLLLKEAFLLESGMADAAAVVAAARQTFLEAHLAVLTAGVRRALGTRAPQYLRDACSVLAARCPEPAGGPPVIPLPSFDVEGGPGCEF